MEKIIFKAKLSRIVFSFTASRTDLLVSFVRSFASHESALDSKAWQMRIDTTALHSLQIYPMTLVFILFLLFPFFIGYTAGGGGNGHSWRTWSTSEEYGAVTLKTKISPSLPSFPPIYVYVYMYSSGCFSLSRFLSLLIASLPPSLSLTHFTHTHIYIYIYIGMLSH